MLPKEIIEDLCCHSGKGYCTLREIIKKRGSNLPNADCKNGDSKCEIKIFL